MAVSPGCAETVINMANSVAPDSWEQQADSGDTTAAQDKSLESKFSTLNVNAAEFVPSFCIKSSPQNNSLSGSSSDASTNAVNTTATSMPPETYHGSLFPFFLCALETYFIRFSSTFCDFY